MEQLTLGQLIEKLERCDQEKTVWFDFSYMKPTGRVYSYRGYYEQLAIEYTDSNEDYKVSDLLKELKSALGKTFCGYKGGEYEMNEHTAVWVDKHNYASGTAIVDVSEGYCVLIRTAMIDRLWN